MFPMKLNTQDLSAREIDDILDVAISRAFVEESAARQRSPYHMGLSALGGCTRAMAHQAAGTTPSDGVVSDEGRAANLGTWQHNGLLPRLANQIAGARSEVEVLLRAEGLRIRGHIDLPAPDLVVDLKTVGEYRLQLIRRNGAVLSHLIQVAAYGVALLQAGQHISWLSLVYMDRANGEIEKVTVPFTNRLAIMAINRVAEVRRHADNPDEAPRVDAGGGRLYGPGFGFQCNQCPWLRRCWGQDARPGKRLDRQYDRPEVERLLLEYDQTRARESEARRRKDEILGLLQGVSHGEYGAVKYGRGRESQVDDGAAAIRILRELGVPVPKTWRKGPVVVQLTKAPKIKNARRKKP